MKKLAVEGGTKAKTKKQKHRGGTMKKERLKRQIGISNKDSFFSLHAGTSHGTCGDLGEAQEKVITPSRKLGGMRAAAGAPPQKEKKGRGDLNTEGERANPEENICRPSRASARGGGKEKSKKVRKKRQSRGKL